MKILDSDFRKELYKNLTEAGYTKAEAQKIVGKKYYEALKEATKESLETLIANVNSDVFDFSSKETIESNLAELEKLKDIIS